MDQNTLIQPPTKVFSRKKKNKANVTLHIKKIKNFCFFFQVANSTCFVFYLPPSMTNDSLRNLFLPYGTVLNAYVAVDSKTNRPRGFGFVDFQSPAEAQLAVQKLDKYPIEGKFLSVSIKI